MRPSWHLSSHLNCPSSIVTLVTCTLSECFRFSFWFPVNKMWMVVSSYCPNHWRCFSCQTFAKYTLRVPFYLTSSHKLLGGNNVIFQGPSFSCILSETKKCFKSFMGPFLGPNNFQDFWERHTCAERRKVKIFNFYCPWIQKSGGNQCLNWGNPVAQSCHTIKLQQNVAHFFLDQNRLWNLSGQLDWLTVIIIIWDYSY